MPRPKSEHPQASLPSFSALILTLLLAPGCVNQEQNKIPQPQTCEETRCMVVKDSGADGGPFDGSVEVRGEAAKGTPVCPCGPTMCELGATFADGCNACSCTASGTQCTLTACAADAGTSRDWTCTSPGQCVFLPGCTTLRGSAPPTVFARYPNQDFCGCDGKTFRSAFPMYPYRHLGVCE